MREENAGVLTGLRKSGGAPADKAKTSHITQSGDVFSVSAHPPVTRSPAPPPRPLQLGGGNKGTPAITPSAGASRRDPAPKHPAR